MVRWWAGLLAGGVASGFLLVAATQVSADGAETPVIAGSFDVKVKPGKSGLPDNFKSAPGIRTYTFGSGCPVGSSCPISRTTSNGDVVDSTMKAAGGGMRWSSSQKLDCFDPQTGALRTPGGADFSLQATLAPSATAVRDGVTYVTAMRGTMVQRIVINGAGRADNCTIPPNNSLSETERSVLTATLTPLATPTSTSPPAAFGVEPDAAAATGSIPAFTLPQTDRQGASAAAVASGIRSSVPGALVTPSEAIRTVGERLPQDLLLVALLGLLIVFPAQVFNSTYEENHERIDRQLARLRLRRRRPGPAAEAPEVPEQRLPDDALVSGAAPPPPPPVLPPEPVRPPRARRLLVFLACVLVGTLLGGLLDPKFGANTASYALVVGIFASVLLAVLVAALTGRVFRSATHRDSGWYLQAIPTALLIAVACVVVSRLTSFEPGYLYGVLGGAVFAGALGRRSEGRAEVVVMVVGLTVALLAWIGFDVVARTVDGADPSFLLLSADSFLAALFIGGLEGLLFGLIPLRFLPGARVKGWSWLAWAALMLVVLYAFVHVLLLPESGYLGRSTAASVTVTLALFITFGVASGLFWLYFRLRPTPEEPPAEGDTSVAVPVEASPVGVATTPTPDSTPDPSPGSTPAPAPTSTAGGTTLAPARSAQEAARADDGSPPVPRQSGPPDEETS